MNHLLLAGLGCAGLAVTHLTALYCTVLYCTVHLHPSLQPNIGIDLVSAEAGPGNGVTKEAPGGGYSVNYKVPIYCR